MKIITPFYQFCRENFEYIIANNSSGNYVVEYKLFKVENNVEIPLTTSTIPIGEEDVLVFPNAGIYSLHLLRPDPDDTTKRIADIYSIRYFPTIKENIIITMADVICDCGSLDNMSASCIIGNSTPTIQTTYDIEMLYNSVGMYRDMLLSPSFLRPL